MQLLRNAVMGAALLALATLFAANPAYAGVTTYDASALFTAAADNLSTYDFSFVDATYGAGGAVGVNNGFLLGPNLSLAGTTNVGHDLALVGSNFIPLNRSGKAGIASDYGFNVDGAGKGVAITFLNPVTAASVDVFTAFSSYPWQNADAVISVFSGTNSLLGQYSVTPATGIKFFGVTSDGGTTIGRIEVNEPTGWSAGVNQIQYGRLAPAGAVPELGSGISFSILSLSGWLALRGKIRRRQSE